MPFKIAEESENYLSLVNDTGTLRIDFAQMEPMAAFLRIGISEPKKEDWKIHGAKTFIGNHRKPFALAREVILAAVKSNELSEAGPDELYQSAYGCLKATGKVRFVNSTLHMHDACVAEFLEKRIAALPQVPENLKACLEHYRLTAEDFATNSTRYFFTSDLSFDDDWQYAMAIDLIKRQADPESAVCILVAAEPADSDFVTGWIRFRSQLNQISDRYLHFFALSDVNGLPSASGKAALVEQLRANGVQVRANEAFFVAVELKLGRSWLGRRRVEAKFLGSISLAGKVTSDDVEPLLTEFVKLARDCIQKNESFDVFVNKLIKKVAWVRTWQRTTRFLGLLDKLKAALASIKP